jgi:transcriptional regulator with XRE-family HTH domain
MPKKPELSEEDEALRREFGDRVRTTREGLGLKPLEFAAIGGVSQAHQYRIEAGDRTAEVLYVQRLQKRFGGLIVSMLFGESPVGQQPKSGGGISLVNHAAGSVQVGYAGGKVKVKKGQ